MRKTVQRVLEVTAETLYFELWFNDCKVFTKNLERKLSEQGCTFWTMTVSMDHVENVELVTA